MSLISFDDPVEIQYNRHGQRSHVIKAVCLPDTDPKAMKAIRHYEKVQAQHSLPNPTPKQRQKLEKELYEARLKIFPTICTDMPNVGVDQGGERVCISSTENWHEQVPEHERQQVVLLYLARSVIDGGEAGN